MKMLRVTMSDGSKWDIPAEILAKARATYYADEDARKDGMTQEQRDKVYEEELAYTLSDADELIDWASNNTDWREVQLHAKRVVNAADVDYRKDWVNADKEVVEVD